MNQQNLEQLFRNYMEQFEYFIDPKGGGHEAYKWDAVGHVQKTWDLSAEDLSGMIRNAFSHTLNLVNNRIVSPGNGLALLAKEEPEAVREAFRALLADTEDVDRKQDQALRFVDDMNALLEKHFPGKWKYAQDLRVAVTYLALIRPDRDFLYKSTPAHFFARFMEFPADLGYGAEFRLKLYYQMCEELIAAIRMHPELTEKCRERKVSWKDESLHLLATDLIFCFEAYPFMRNGMNEPPRNTKAAAAAREAAARAERIRLLQEEIEKLQDQIEKTEWKIGELPQISLEGMKVRTKAFGTAVVERQEGSYISLTAGGKERSFVLPDCVAKGFAVPEDQAAEERYLKEAAMQAEIAELTGRQKSLDFDIKREL